MALQDTPFWSENPVIDILIGVGIFIAFVILKVSVGFSFGIPLIPAASAGEEGAIIVGFAPIVEEAGFKGIPLLM